MNLSFRPLPQLLLLSALSLLLSACPSHQQPANRGTPTPVISSGNTTPTTTPPANTKPVVPANGPQVSLPGNNSKQAFDRLADMRAKKDMKTKTRSKTQLTVARLLPQVKGKPLEEVRISYQINQQGNTMLLTARAYQVQQPDTFTERVTDITPQLAERIQAELDELAAGISR